MFVFQLKETISMLQMSYIAVDRINAGGNEKSGPGGSMCYVGK